MADRRMNRALLVSLAAAATLMVGPASGCGQSKGDQPGGSTPTGEVAESGLPIELVTIRDKQYRLELASTASSRFKGLSDRETIPENGGMLFAFARPERRYFVMRDCLTSIDIIYLDGTGRITATHHMETEPLRQEGESQAAYERRLRRYSSRGASQFVIELAGGQLKTFDPPLQRGERIELDTERLAELAEP